MPAGRPQPATAPMFMLDRLTDLNRRAFLDGVKTFSPAVPATFSWGLVTGIAMAKTVLTIPQALGMSLAVYAGSSQLAVLPLFAAKLPLWTILLTAAMVNLLGDLWQGGEPDWAEALRRDPGVKLHLYGKSEARPGRKMGHYCVLAPTVEAALKIDAEAQRLLS